MYHSPFPVRHGTTAHVLISCADHTGWLSLCRNTSEEPNSGVKVVPQWIQIREQMAQTPSNFDNGCAHPIL